MDNTQQELTALKRQVAAIYQQVMGNNPSSNYVQYLQVGGSQAGWFQLTNGPVNTFINNNTNPAAGIITEVSLQSIDIASNFSGSVGPFQISLNSPLGEIAAFITSLIGGHGYGTMNLTSDDSTGGAILMGASSAGQAYINMVNGGGTPVSIGPSGAKLPDLILTNPAANGVLLAEGSSVVASTGPGAAGQVLTSNGAGADPSWQAVAGTTGFSGVATLAKLTTLGSAGSLTFVNGLATAYVPPT